MKKKKVNPAQTDRLYVLTSDPKLKKILHHLLSPIEMEAFRHRFTPFTYNLEGVPLFIDSHAAGMMLWRVKCTIKDYHVVYKNQSGHRSKARPEEKGFPAFRPKRFS